MPGFYFSSLPKLKIRRGGVVDDISPLPPVSFSVFVPGIAVPQAPETMVSISFFNPLAPEMTSRKPSVPFPAGPMSSSKNFRRSGKRKAAADSKEETSMPGKRIENTRDSWRTG
ncbi:hypothetical protein Fot_06762 [Forsythia ovata]|uniref:Uncharacterized protein n=1 Tax=Forsythia ovata TaxID=205694 RepID=A0ABD1WWT1_9LAMI